MHSATTTEQVAQSHNNYHIKNFDSSVKHAVYPSPETDKMISWGIAFGGSFLVLIAFLKVILSCAGNFSYFSISQYKMKAVYSLLRDLAIFVFILSIVLMLHFHSYLDWYHTNLENLLYGLYIFTALWIFSSIVLFYTCYVRLETFLDYESISQDQEKLRDLKNVYEAMMIDDHNISSSIRRNLNFQIMRQGFICPVELPILTESFLRRDFNFCMYLGYCITDFLSEIIGFINLKFYFFVGGLMVSYRLIETLNVEPGSGLIYGVPIVCFVLLFLSKWHLETIYFYLVPDVSLAENFEFNVDMDIIDPVDHEEDIPAPLYLTIGYENQDYQEEEESDEDEHRGINGPRESVFRNIREQNKKYSWMFKSGKTSLGYHQNRHERLFWFGWIGVVGQKFIIQGCYMVLILWLSLIIAADGYDRFYVFDNEKVDIPIMIVTILFASFLILYYFPSVMFAYILDTSIQMMKRRDYIELVIKEQKHQKSLRAMRMYQVFKNIRRILIEGLHEDVDDKSILRTPKMLINENHNILNEHFDGEDQLPIEKIDTFAHLNGSKLLKQDSYLLLFKAGDPDVNYVNPENMETAITKISNDVKIDPYLVISRIFYLMANVQYKVSMEQLDEFFRVYKDHFEKDDIIEFRKEILLLRGGAEIDIQEIASLIRDNIECFPR
ncbi:unnamed protein product [Moneuplotes crassus]|uniref:Uncharacterized protein n=1 Tax=Euplotes crassus TaxID=5936 RepID=A0AAD2DAQ6_EUPCR|nr:unnamed protein product [Moneuplotes crassus]